MNPILLNPGPVTLSERVRTAMLRPDLCHREVEFAELQGGLRSKLLEIYDLSANDWAAARTGPLTTCRVEHAAPRIEPRHKVPVSKRILSNLD